MASEETTNPSQTALRQRLQGRTRTVDMGGPSPRRIYDQISIVAMVLDTGLRVVRFNRAAERLFGKPFADVLGRPYDEVLEALGEINYDHVFQRAIALGVPCESREIKVYDHEAGRKFYFDFQIDPVLDDNGDMAGVSIIGYDVTQRVQLKRSLANQNEDLKALQQVSDALRKTMDLDKAFIIIASALTSAEAGAYDHAMIFTLDQDREYLLGKLCVDSIGLNEAWGMWRGLTAHDGPLRQTLESIQPALAKRWGKLTDQIRRVKVPLTDHKSILVHAVRTGQTVTHRTLHEHPNLKIHDEIQKRLGLRNFAAAPMVVDRDAIGVIVVDSERPRSFSPERLTMLEMFADQAALAINNGMIYQNVLEQAQRDSLTGLYNHGHLQANLRAELERAERYEQPLSFIMVDIDHFKKFNDDYGHQTGDHVLKQVALLLTALVRVTDLVARYGGEEFSVILPQTDHGDALDTAQRLRSGIERKVVVMGPKGEKLNVTASFGVATFPADAKNAAGLIGAADEALYAAKDRGRNCVVSKVDVKGPRPGRVRRPSRKLPRERTIRVKSTPVGKPPSNRRKSSGKTTTRSRSGASSRNRRTRRKS